MRRLTRRDFIKATAATGLGLATQWNARSYAQIAGANDAIRVAVVGFNGRGKSHITDFTKMDGVRLVALCDVDDQVMAGMVERLGRGNLQVKQYRDIRKLLADPEIDAISIATPNHWHALMAVWACQAGKDVYVEKPVTHSIWEGRKVVEAAEKHQRIVQCGMQRRSDAGWIEAMAWLKAGNLGKVLFSRALCYKPRKGIGKAGGPQTIPEFIDYDLWSGPRQTSPLTRKNLHYDWHWFWPTGNGDLGNQGVHQMDVAAWAIDKDKELAPGVISIGGRFSYDDDGQTPNMQLIILDYKPAPIIFEVRNLVDDTSNGREPVFKNIRIGNVIECEGGYLCEDGAFDKQGKQINKLAIGGGGDHIGNFIKAVRSRKSSDLTAPPIFGHISSALCHMGNISQRLGRAAPPEALDAAFKDNSSYRETLESFRGQLSHNGVDLNVDRLTLGPHLKFDPRQEAFVGLGPLDDEANRHLKDPYRDPFVIPETI